MEFKPFEYPEVQKLFGDLCDQLLSESGRGALLVASAQMDDQLTQLIDAFLPKEMTSKDKKRLFKYPGHLSSFASKIELAYAFRLIDGSLYNCLNALRSLPNDAAHTTSNFELHELSEKLKSIFNLGSGFQGSMSHLAKEAFLKMKLNLLKDYLDESGLELEDRKRIFFDAVKNEEVIASLEKQVPYWELITGLSFLCGLIVLHKKRLQKLVASNILFSDLIKNEKEN